MPEPKKTEKSSWFTKKPKAEEPTPAATVTAAATTETTTASTAETVVEVVAEEPKGKRCQSCGRKWSAPAPDACPECGGSNVEE